MNSHMRRLAILTGAVLLCAASLSAGPPAGGSGQADALLARGDNARVSVLISFRHVPGPSEQALVRSRGGAIKYSYRVVPGIAASLPEKAVAALLASPGITRIEPDGQVNAIDAELDRSWGVKRIGAGVVHTFPNTGARVKVAIIDTGIDYSHPDLAANYGGGYDFVNGDDDPMDDHSHGTHVAGIVAARDDDAGVVGVAPDAELYALKILDASGSGNDSDLIAAMEWAVTHSMQVVNLSLGTSADPGSLVQQVFDEAQAAGVVTVAAAGNADFFGLIGNTVQWPARYDSVIAVGATDNADSLAYYSSTGPEVELAAPGNNIYSTVLNGQWAAKSGTSMATPHVAGTAALVIAAGYADVRDRLRATADELGVPGRDTWYGYGLVDADEAAEPTGGPALPPVADFMGTPTSGNVPLTVQFTDLSTGTLTGWLWDFGDGQTFDQQNPSHTYTSAGTYTISLTVTNGEGSDKETKVGYVTVMEAPSPVADFMASPTSGTAPLTVDFMDLSTDATAWSWDFDDGGSSTVQNPSHTYDNPGSYAVTLTATGPGGTDTVTKTDFVSVAAPEPPRAATTMYVSEISMRYRRAGKNYFVYTQVTVLDDLEAVVPDATVVVKTAVPLQGNTSLVQMGVTGPDGAVVLSLKWREAGTYISTVTDVSHGSLTYEPSSNAETTYSYDVP